MHLDIAGTAWTRDNKPYIPKGATGVGIRLLVKALEDMVEDTPQPAAKKEKPKAAARPKAKATAGLLAHGVTAPRTAIRLAVCYPSCLLPQRADGLRRFGTAGYRSVVGGHLVLAGLWLASPGPLTSERGAF